MLVLPFLPELVATQESAVLGLADDELAPGAAPNGDVEPAELTGSIGVGGGI